MTLDKKDKEILFQLDKNARQPYSKIAKKVKLSKETCTYKINKMIKDRVISNFLTLISLSHLGLQHYKIYFQFHKATKENIQNIIYELKQNFKINWIGECIGEFDLIISILCKTPKEFNLEKEKILQKYNEYILNYCVGTMADTYIYDKNYLCDELIHENDLKMIDEKTTIKFDHEDKEIIKLLIDNARITNVEIAKKTGLNIKTVISKIKKLENNHIISSYKIFFNYEQIGYKYYKLFIQINKMDPKEYNAFLAYCKNNRNIIYLVENVGSWELEPEIEIDTEDKFYAIVAELKQKFPNLIKKINIVRIIKDHKHIFVPKEIIDEL